MEPINQLQKKELEDRLGFRICPLTVEEIDHPIHIGLYLNAGPVTKYRCAVDGGLARGGTPSTIMMFTAIRPCPEEYAENCPSYNNHRMMITYFFQSENFFPEGEESLDKVPHTDNRKRLNEPTMENFID